jgi:hypothetical protein
VGLEEGLADEGGTEEGEERHEKVPAGDASQIEQRVGHLSLRTARLDIVFGAPTETRGSKGTEAKRRMPKKPRLPRMEYISGFTLAIERWLVPENERSKWCARKPLYNGVEEPAALFIIFFTCVQLLQRLARKPGCAWT